MHSEKPISLRIFYAKHYSSASFRNQHKADLDVRSLSSGRFTMPIWYTVMFLVMTLGTFASHIWSQVTNYTDMQESLSLTIPTIILVISRFFLKCSGNFVISSLLIGLLLYLTIYMVGFLLCCENNFTNKGLLTVDLDYSAIYVHFCELNHIEKRIYATKAIQFVLLWYTMILSIYANIYELNIYPALGTVLTNGFGLMLFARCGRLRLKILNSFFQRSAIC
ncbi:hypothetical protein OESDEN_16909 [Oesophagostomum dentatum]|uniref:Uncharacterized protein n=1 Tax=Oesophagostomum dentatum TaxID=61180 RepID=A0A0B1SEM6_OESDE|nr:hypothetical protein OESDEN_16909 [Oesophagostomum dentatum]